MLEKTIKIASFDVYPNSTLKPSALQRYMQQIAREDCDNMGCTYIDMRNVNMVFVLTKLAIEISAPIYAYDEIVIKTFNNRISGVSFEREFELYKNGAKVAHATTQWVIVNYDTRRIVRPKDFPFNIPEHNLDCGSLPLPRTISGETVPQDLGVRVVRLSDLDENNHLNNCVYPDIAMDIIDYDTKNQYVKSVVIIFKHEAVLGDSLKLSLAKSGSNNLVFAYNANSDAPCFEAMLGLAEINN